MAYVTGTTGIRAEPVSRRRPSPGPPVRAVPGRIPHEAAPPRGCATEAADV